MHAIWYKVPSIRWNFGQWNMTWICRPQNHLTIQHQEDWRQKRMEDSELNQARLKPDTVDGPMRTARIFVHHYPPYQRKPPQRLTSAPAGTEDRRGFVAHCTTATYIAPSNVRCYFNTRTTWASPVAILAAAWISAGHCTAALTIKRHANDTLMSVVHYPGQRLCDVRLTEHREETDDRVSGWGGACGSPWLHWRS